MDRQDQTTVFVTVDTEEDNWGDYGCQSPKVTNITFLPEFQSLCTRYGAAPTYLCNWPTIANDSSREILAELAAGGGCEIGSHVHPMEYAAVSRGDWAIFNYAE